MEKQTEENILYTAPRLSIVVLTATGASWTGYYCVVVEG